MLSLEQNEKIVLRTRRHWFALLVRLLPIVPFILIPIILFVLAETTHIDLNTFTPPVENSVYPSEPLRTENFVRVETSNPASTENPPAPSSKVSMGLMFLFSWFLLMWIGAFIIWTDYFLDVLIVTNKRIINIEQKALFSREIASLRLDKIQDITIDINGVLATFLSFGNIRIQTAGEQEEFLVRFIKNPESLKSTILKEHDRVSEELREVRIAKD